ncbi:repressor of RNA polymerase III transcription Maf1p [Diutina catenulata]
MKFMEEVDIELINQELNFEPHGANLIIKGGCDLFSIKKVRDDNRLFKTIDAHLDQIIEDNQLSRSFDERRHSSSGYASSVGSDKNGRRPSHVPPFTSEGSRHNSVSDRRDSVISTDDLDESPFGPLREVRTRKTFAYLISILNTTFPDHDFSNLQPTTENFHRISSMDDLITRVNNTLVSLGKRQDQLSWMWDTLNVYMDIIPSHAGSPRLGAQEVTPSSRPSSRKSSFNAGASSSPPPLQPADIQVYSFQPSDDSILEDLMYPYQTMWQNYYFVYNRRKRRVAFLYLTALNKMHYQLAGGVSASQSNLHDSASNDIDLDGDDDDIDLDGDDDDDFNRPPEHHIPVIGDMDM